MKCVVFSLLAVAACSNKTEPSTALTTTKKEYVGDWEGGTTKVHIEGDGHVIYERGTTRVVQTIDHFEGNDVWFVTGMMFGSNPNARLRIQAAPAESGGDWKMTVEDAEVTRNVYGGPKLETKIRDSLAAKGVMLKSIGCPTSTSGGSFDCSLENADGDKLVAHCTYDLTWNTSWKIDTAIIHPHTIEPGIAAFIKTNQNVTVPVTCPSNDLLKPPGSTFNCDAGGFPVVVTVDDDQGHVHFVTPTFTAPPVASASASASSSKKSQAFDPFSISRR